MATVQFFQPHEGRHFDGPLDLNEHLVRHPAATFFMRAASDSQRDLGIHAGDLLVIDRAARPVPGKAVVAVRGGEIRLERFRHASGAEEELELWGVITHVIRKL